MGFEWDENKNKTNIRKHGIDFNDAVEIFDGPMLTHLDNRVEYGEGRYIGIGFLRHIIALVVFVEFDNNDMIRIISARKATKNESKRFQKEIKNRLG